MSLDRGHHPSTRRGRPPTDVDQNDGVPQPRMTRTLRGAHSTACAPPARADRGGGGGGGRAPRLACTGTGRVHPTGERRAAREPCVGGCYVDRRAGPDRGARGPSSLACAQAVAQPACALVRGDQSRRCGAPLPVAARGTAVARVVRSGGQSGNADQPSWCRPQWGGAAVTCRSRICSRSQDSDTARQCYLLAENLDI